MLVRTFYSFRPGRYAVASLLVSLAACGGSDSGVVNPYPAPVVPPAFPSLLSLHGPTWLVSGTHASYRASVDFNGTGSCCGLGWSWSSSDPAVQVSWALGPEANVQAGAAGSASLRVWAFGTDTANTNITVLPRPVAATPMEQTPVVVASFRLLQLKTGQSDVFFFPLVNLAQRVPGDNWILEATVELPGVSLQSSRCSTNRKVGEGGPLFGLVGGYYGDPELLMQADSSARATGNPVLHLILTDALGTRTTEVKVTGTLLPYDVFLIPESRYLKADEAWFCD